MALQADSMTDMIRSTLKDLGRGKWSDLTSTLRNHPTANRLLNQKKVTYGDGYGCQFDVLVGDNGSARSVPLGWTAVPNINEGLIQGSVPWRHTEFDWSLIRQEVSMNRGASRIVNLIETRRKRAMASWVKFIENKMWRVPSVSDDVTFYGIPYWIVKSATAAADTAAANYGLNGTVPSGYSTVGGISSTTYPQWRNGTDIYSQVSKDDFVRKLIYMLYATNFTSPVPMPTFGDSGSGQDDKALYTNFTLANKLRELAESQNENIGVDLAPYMGQVTLNRRPVEVVDSLRDDTTNPMYGVDWSEFEIMALEGEWMYETRIEKNPHQPSVYSTYFECTFNTICHNRRSCFVMATGTGMPA
jgi:hypothetical protein